MLVVPLNELCQQKLCKALRNLCDVLHVRAQA